MKTCFSLVLLALSAMARIIGQRAPQIVVAALVCALVPAFATAQNFPAKPLRLIIRAPPGGTDDLLGRIIAQKMGDTLGQQVIVDYRTGAGGLVAWEYVANAAPDGYTLLLAASGLGAIKAMRPQVTIDPWRDFTWVSLITNYQLVLVVHPALPAKTLKELIALARAQPGQLSYGSSGVGATPHLAAEYFKSMAKVDIIHVPYKGAGPMVLDLIPGRLAMGVLVVASAIPHIRSGKLRALGVTGAARVPQLSEVPTIAEGGLSGYEFTGFYAILVPAKTPREIVARFAETIATSVAAPDYRERIVNVGMEPAFNSPEQMLQLAKQDGAKIDRIIRTANIKATD